MDNVGIERNLGDVLNIPVFLPFDKNVIDLIALKKQELMLELSGNDPLKYLTVTQQIDLDIEKQISNWGDEKFVFLGMLTQQTIILKDRLEKEAEEYLKRFSLNLSDDEPLIGNGESEAVVSEKVYTQEGSLFGVFITKPFKRNDIRALVKARHELMVQTAKNGKTLYEASLDLQDQAEAFISTWSIEDQIAFNNLSAEETNALTSKINDDTSKVLIDAANDSMAFQWLIAGIAIIVIFVFVVSR